MNNIIKLIALVIISLSFTACDNKKKSNYVTEYNKKHPKSVIEPLYWDGKEKLFSNFDQELEAGANRAYDISISLYEENKFEEAIKYLEFSDYIIPTAKNSDQACIIFQDIKKFEEAIPWCKQAYELGNELSLVGLALAYRGVKNYDEAINYLNIGIEKNIKNSSNVLGLVYSEKGDYKEAEKWYLKAIKDEPYNSRAHNNISSFYIEDLKDNVKGAAHAIAGIDNVFDVLSVSDLLIIEYKIPLEDLQEAYKLQLTSPDFPIRFKEKGRRVGFLTKEDYQEVIDDYHEDKRREQETIKYEEAQRRIAKEFNERVQRDIEEKEKQQKENER
ncbi:tetratricopeptide repeat protein [Arcobacter vandammei]|uniref:tetratricopeptide repeat protein n=1 Tax=Arcobacter vandammei TaxID=2782243 RepID=UPI0018E009BC|nr:tetratricopeptide repeat protein [Arcobacter vandammei]